MPYSNTINPNRIPERIDKVIDETLTDKRLAGVVIKVALDGQLIYSRAAGYASRELNHPMRGRVVPACLGFQTDYLYGSPDSGGARSPEAG
ncbi:hypothetical protein [Paenibacillus phytohabitans]|uniref:hypothetical protein n=1 Tax=Paenibacillus phytohabitans TaxID=2654978 RepID=UPI003009AD7B